MACQTTIGVTFGNVLVLRVLLSDLYRMSKRRIREHPLGFFEDILPALGKREEPIIQAGWETGRAHAVISG